MDKEKFTLEYPLHSHSQHVIWETISTPSGLAQWFADEVSFTNRHARFQWGEEEMREADIIAMRPLHFIRFHWTDDEWQRSYFELKMTVNDMTGTCMLEVTDFAEPDEVESQTELWNAQIEDLMRNTGM